MKIKYSLLLFLTLLPLSLSAHPHVFIDARVNIAIDTMSLQYIEIEWEFDRMFSSTIISQFDKNRNGTIDSAEIPLVKKGAFDNLREYGYMCHVMINGKKFRIRKVESFSAEYRNKKISYMFRIPVNCSISGSGTVTIAIYDSTSFCDFQLFKTGPLSIKKDEKILIQSQIKRVSYKLDYVTPQEIRIKYQIP